MIEAPGYLPAVSPPYKMEQTEVVFDVKLKKGTGPAGIVRLPDGTPAAGVDVVMATTSGNVEIRNGSYQNRGRGGLSMRTEADGRFQFPPQVDPFVLLAVGDGGFAEVTPQQLQASSDIKLQPWGKVVGRLMIGSKPAASETVVLNYNWTYVPAAPRYQISYESKTDNDGNFVFERAIPKETRVSRRIVTQKTGRYTSYSYSQPDTVTVKPGETVRVQVGGIGRPVIGRVIVPADPASQAWALSGRLATKYLRPPVPDDFDLWTEEKQREWYKRLSETPEAKAFEKNRRHYSFAVAENGSFRVDDVRPGLYDLHVSGAEPSSETGQPVASAKGEVTVPEIPGGQSDEPLDAGTVELKPIKLLKPWDDLSALVIKTIDGEPVKLADYKGKVVVIHSWSSRHQDDPPELPVFKEIYEAFGKDGRVVIIGLNFESPATAKTFAEKNDMKWVQAYVGSRSTVLQDTGLQTSRVRLVIGPDGKVINNVPRLDMLRSEVAGALGKPAP
jgi:peroxiredoxin